MEVVFEGSQSQIVYKRYFFQLRKYPLKLQALSLREEGKEKIVEFWGVVERRGKFGERLHMFRIVKRSKGHSEKGSKLGPKGKFWASGGGVG